MVFGIEYGMGHAGPFEHLTQHLGSFNGNGPHKHRLTLVVEFLDFINGGFEFFPFGFVNDIGKIDPCHFLVGGNDHHFQFIDIIELRRFRVCRTGHAGQLFVHTEVILKGHRGQRLVFTGNFYPLLGLHRLMQAVAPPTSRHHSSREFIHDDDLVVFDDVLDIFFKEPEGFHQLLDGMEQLGCPHVSCFNFPELFFFFSIVEGFILTDVMAFVVHVGEHEIIRPFP